MKDKALRLDCHKGLFPLNMLRSFQSCAVLIQFVVCGLPVLRPLVNDTLTYMWPDLTHFHLIVHARR